MENYRTGWLTTVIVAATAGVWTMLAWSVVGALGCFVASAVITGCVATARSGDLRWRAALSAGVFWGYVLVGGMGLAVLMGVFVLLLILAIAACSPMTIVWARRLSYWHRASPQTGEPMPSAGEARAAIEPLPSALSIAAEKSGAPPDLDSMGDAALCMAWRASFIALQQQLHHETRVRVVERRQQYLDELERRNPAGFTAWMTSGPRAAGDPSRYIIITGPREHPDRRV